MRMMHIILDMELLRLTDAARPFLENGGTFGAIEFGLLIYAVLLHLIKNQVQPMHIVLLYLLLIFELVIV